MLEGEILLNQDMPTADLNQVFEMLGQIRLGLAQSRRTILWIKSGAEDEELDSAHDDLLGCMMKVDGVRSTLFKRYFVPIEPSVPLESNTEALSESSETDIVEDADVS